MKMNSENNMNIKIGQKICEYELGTSMDTINLILEEGYEIADIVPALQASGGGISRRVHGLYTIKVVLLLNPSDKKTTVKFRMIINDTDYLNNLNQVLSEENESGFSLLKIISNDAFLDPEACSGIGRGTYGFGLFFVKEVM